MWASRYGIAFFEDRVERGMNYNLTIEVASMLITGRRVALLRDAKRLRKLDRQVTSREPGHTHDIAVEWVIVEELP